MMQVAVEIVTSLLTYRMRHLMPHLIHVEHIGFITGGSPNHHVHFLSDVQYMLSETE